MTKVLVTGSAGFVGSHVVEHLLQNTDWEIIGLDSFRHRGDALRVNHLDTTRYRILTMDAATPVSDRMKLEIGPVDFILNVASESHVDRSITDPVPFIQNNVNLGIYMLELAIDLRPKAFIQVSTDEVYGAAPEGLKHAEWSPILPSNPYAASKACQEAIAISYWRTFMVPLVITNTMNMYGERQDTEKFIPKVIQKVRQGEMVTIHGTKEYIGSRHYLHARNFADALLFLMNRVLKDKSYQDSLHYRDSAMVSFPERVNVVGDVEVNNLQLALMIAGMLKCELKYQFEDFHKTRPGHDRRYALDGNKLASMGWRAPVNFENSLRKTIEWTMERKEWLR